MSKPIRDSTQILRVTFPNLKEIKIRVLLCGAPLHTIQFTQSSLRIEKKEAGAMSAGQKRGLSHACYG